MSSQNLLSSLDMADTFTVKRHRQSTIWRRIFYAATAIGVIALIALIYNVIDQSFGYVILKNKVDLTTISSTPLDEMTTQEMTAILKSKLSKGEVGRLDKEKPFELRSVSNLQDLMTEKVIQPSVEESYTLTDTIFRQSEIKKEWSDKYPNDELVFRSWVTPQFLSRPMSSKAEFAGVRSALLGSLWMIMIAILFAFPIGVGAAIYLEEYASNSRINRIIQTNIDNLAGVPSIVYGILGLAIFVRGLSFLTSGQLFGIESSNGRTLLSAGLTMGLLVLPVLIINTQEAIRAVPGSLRLASYGLGATQWQTIWYHVLPHALPGILTGTILAISRAIGETAPLIVVGASTFITRDPSGPFSQFTVLPIQIYNWVTRPQAEFHNIAAAAILVLLTTLLSLNAVAILLRNRYSRRNA